MNSKKAITLLVLATLLLSMVPMGSAALSMGLSTNTGVYGDTVMVTGGTVPAGTTVELYWDDTTIAWNGVKGKLNETTAAGDGTYEVWFDVPEATNGNHYVWVKASGDAVSAVFTVTATVDLSSSSGLSGDKVDADAYGQAGEKDISLVMVATSGIANWNWNPTGPVAITVATGTDYDGSISGIVRPGTVGITDTVETFTDNGDGTLTGSLGGTGKINYATGEWEVSFNTAPTVNLALTYSVFTPLTNVAYELSTSGETNAVGSYNKDVTIPVANQGNYFVESLDAKGNSGSGAFTLGAVITATPDAAAVGDLITVKGRGFLGDDIDYADGVTVGGLPAVINDGDGVVIDGDDEFTLKLFVPQMPDEDDYTISISDGTSTATVEIEVTALAEITITPDYGPQGQTVSVSGVNFPNLKEEDIGLELSVGGVWIKDFETSSDGSWSGTFRIPAEVDGNYDINAYWDSPRGEGIISATDAFRIGSILVLLSDDEGPAGLKVILSGNGFTENEGWNATFGDETIFEGETVDANGLLKDGGGVASFYVPQVEPGVYDIMVLDEDTGIEVVTEFTVTDATSFEIIPNEAPAGYNITFEGMYWSEDQDPTFEFWVFNDTDEWDITSEVWLTDGAFNPFMTDPDGGAFEAWWSIGHANPTTAADIFEKGTYYLNVTYGDWLYQTTFVVGDEHVSIGSRKSTFRIEDTLSFDIEHSFGNNPGATIGGGMIDIYDPSGDLYFTTNNLWTGIWIKSGMYYYVPVAQQTANGNPMVLLDDAPLGEWSYEWLDKNSDLIAEGTFLVEVSREDEVSGKIDDLNSQITGLQDTVSDVTSEFDDVRSDIADVAAIAEQAVDAANTAADAIQTVAQTANTASEAAQNAADAANAAKDAASGLTSLVYGAIAASLVAALAAVVSLMQISRRIAG